MADSFYEYMLKLWIIDDRTNTTFRREYDLSAEVRFIFASYSNRFYKAIHRVLARTTPNGDVYLGVGDNSWVSQDMEHLVSLRQLYDILDT